MEKFYEREKYLRLTIEQGKQISQYNPVILPPSYPIVCKRKKNKVAFRTRETEYMNGECIPFTQVTK